MKPSKEYFNEDRPFDAQSDGSLLDAMEQAIASASEANMVGLRWEIGSYRQPDGTLAVAVTLPGGQWTFYAPTLREALRDCFNTEL